MFLFFLHFRFCEIASGDLEIDDERISRKVSNMQGNFVQAKFLRLYKVPKRTFRDWRAIYKNPTKAFQEGMGRASKLDTIAQLDFKRKTRELAFPQLHNNVVMKDVQEEVLNEPVANRPRPPRRGMVKQLLKEGAMATLARGGRVLKRHEEVSISKTTEYKYRRDLTSRRKAKDLTDARYIALADFQHMFQSCIMICVLFLFIGVNGVIRYFTPEEKANFDCTAFKVDQNETGQVIIKLKR